MSESAATDFALLELLRRVAAGGLSPAEALAAFHAERLAGGAAVPQDVHPDLSRAARTGMPEVIYGEGKSPAQVGEIAARLLATDGRLLVTRATSAQAEALVDLGLHPVWHDAARAITVGLDTVPRFGRVTVLSAGTTDVPVAEEAALTAEMLGAVVERVYDVGVAGLHRLLGRLSALEGSHVHIVVAGMDGALASVVGGLVAEPIIAVPTSVGYGAVHSGLSALLAMLASCAPGVLVVNIDNGFGAGFAAGRLNALVEGRGRQGTGVGPNPATDGGGTHA